jgi:hypothetical protein
VCIAVIQSCNRESANRKQQQPTTLFIWQMREKRRAVFLALEMNWKKNERENAENLDKKSPAVAK